MKLFKKMERETKKTHLQNRKNEFLISFTFYRRFPPFPPAFLLGGLFAYVAIGFPAEAAAAAAEAAAAAGVGTPEGFNEAVKEVFPLLAKDAEAPATGTAGDAATPNGGSPNALLVALNLNRVDWNRE